METGRVIQERYLMQRLVKQTSFCTIHQGMDRRLQRAVIVKSVQVAHIATYKMALKMSANFSNQYIIGLYDLIIEPDVLYIVQEYIEGDTFETLVHGHLSAFEVAEAGWQMCQALIYAGSTSRRVCHNDLTPTAVMRDRQGIFKINDFALPGDLNYFQKWSMLGAEGVPLLEMDLPWGQQSEARRADDTRAVGLLLYQLLAGSSEPPVDGRLRFARGIPPELCEIIARTVVRQHPQNINTPDALYAQLKLLAEALEPPLPMPAAINYLPEEPLVRQYSPVGAARLAPALPARDNEHGGRGLSSYSGKLPSLEHQPATAVQANMALNPEIPRNSYNQLPTTSSKPRSSTMLLLLLGLLAFVLFFVIGYFLGHMLIH